MPTTKPSNLKIFFPAFFACLFFALAGEARATTYYAAPNGSDNNPGTLAQPWATFSYANNRIAEGDTVIARGGTYARQSVGITKANTTWKAYSGEHPVLDGEF